MAQGVFSDEEDTALRADAIRFLELRTNDGAIPITRAELAEFTFKGEPFPLIDRQRGIRKPAVLRSALSISTKYTRPGQSRPYDDQIMSNSPVLRYKWRGRYCQDLWIGMFQAASSWLGEASSGLSRTPFLKVVPARTSAARWGALMALRL